MQAGRDNQAGRQLGRQSIEQTQCTHKGDKAPRHCRSVSVPSPATSLPFLTPAAVANQAAYRIRISPKHSTWRPSLLLSFQLTFCVAIFIVIFFFFVYVRHFPTPAPTPTSNSPSLSCTSHWLHPVVVVVVVGIYSAVVVCCHCHILHFCLVLCTSGFSPICRYGFYPSACCAYPATSALRNYR